jgi:hypothetical protein
MFQQLKKGIKMQVFMRAIYATIICTVAITFILYKTDCINIKDFLFVMLALAGCIFLVVLIAWGF